MALFVSRVITITALSNTIAMVVAYIIAAIICIGLAVIILDREEREIEKAQTMTD